MGVRLAKTFADDKATFALSVENPAMLVSGTAPTGAVINPTTAVPTGSTGIVFGGVGTGQFGNGNNYSANLAPDLIAKVAFDPGFGHYELKVVGRFFRDRIGETAVPRAPPIPPWGRFRCGAIVPVMKKKLDFIAQAMAGRGIGRYGDSSDTANGDVTYRPNGSFFSLKNLQIPVASKRTRHRTRPCMFMAETSISAGYLRSGATATGYGVPNRERFRLLRNWHRRQLLHLHRIPRAMIQGTVGFWYNFYKGAYGTLRAGAVFVHLQQLLDRDRRFRNNPRLGSPARQREHGVHLAPLLPAVTLTGSRMSGVRKYASAVAIS